MQTVNLTAIKDGTSDPAGQTLTVTATSSNTALVTAPTVLYTSPNATGTLTYNINPFVSGTATITVTVMDSGSTAGGGVVSSTQSYTITVTPVNQQPTLNPINPSSLTIPENSAAQTDQPDGHHRRSRRQLAGPGGLRHHRQPRVLRAVGQLHPRQHHRHGHLHTGGQRQRYGDDRRLRDG